MKQLFVLLMMVTISVVATAQRSEIFSDSGTAVKGYDVVAYFTEGKAVKGDRQLTYKWKEANWHFSHQKNLDLFKANPEKYAPQFGGYCAYGTSRGYKAPTEPEAFTIADGKLYLNYNLQVRTVWDKNRQAFIEKANTHWPNIKDKE